LVDSKHLEIVKKGKEAFVQWRKENPDLRLELSSASLSGANLIRANLSYADLSGANLFRANLSYSDLSGADLSNSNLEYTNFDRTKLRKTVFNNSIFGETRIINCDLREAIGLETVKHKEPSRISFDSIMKPLIEGEGELTDVLKNLFINAGVNVDILDNLIKAFVKDGFLKCAKEMYRIKDTFDNLPEETTIRNKNSEKMSTL